VRVLNADSSILLLLEEGRKTEAEEVSGFGAVNAGVPMARLGMDVAVLAKLGSDERADTILRHLKQDGVSTAWGGAIRAYRRVPLFSFPHMTEMQLSLHFEVPTRC
jgi:hypothetical protein